MIRLLMALVLAFFSNLSFSATLSCSSGLNKPVPSPSPAAICAQTPYANNADVTYTSKGVLSVVTSSTSPNAPTSGRCAHHYDYSSSALTDGDGSWTFNCTGTVCANGITPSAANNWSCDLAADDCSTSVGTGGKDLSGVSTDGTCQCPSGKETLNTGTSSASCADPCAVGTTRDTTGLCKDNCNNGFAWNDANSYCDCDGYPGDVNGVLTCIKATNSQLGAIASNTEALADAVAAAGAKQDATNQGITNIQNQNTTIINGQAQQLSAMGATAASAASTATSTAAGAASSATTASNTATIASASQATQAAAEASNAKLDDLAGGIGALNQTATAIKNQMGTGVTSEEEGTPSHTAATAKAAAMSAMSAIGNAPILSAGGNVLAAFPASGGSCAALSVELFGRTVSTSTHCTVFDSIKGGIAPIMMVVWSILGVFIFRRL